MAREMTMWGDVAELMMELSTAHCYCKYIGLEKRGSFSEDSQQTVASSCYREAIMDKKAGFIWWALPLHLERMKQ